MRISKNALYRGWAWSTGLGLIAAAIWASLDLQLKALTGVSTADLQELGSAAQYRLAFHAWAPEPYAVRAGFDLGFDYLLMPLYAASFFLSGVIAAEGFTPGRHPLRRYVLLAAMVAPVGALLNAALNALQLVMLLTGASEGMARLAYGLGTAMTWAILIGMALLVAALVARFGMRRKAATAAAKTEK